MYKPFQVTTSTILKEFSLNNQSSITYQLISLRFFIYWILTNYTPMIYVIYFSKSACSAFSNRSCYFDILSRKNEFIMQTGWNFTFTTKPLCLCFFVCFVMWLVVCYSCQYSPKVNSPTYVQNQTNTSRFTVKVSRPCLEGIE